MWSHDSRIFPEILSTTYSQQITIIHMIKLFCCSIIMSDSLWPCGLQHARLLCLPLPPRVCSISYPLSPLAIQPCHPLSSPSPALNLSKHQDLFQWVGSLHYVVKYWSFNFSNSPSNEYSGLISLRIELIWSPCCPRDSQESSPTTVQKHQFSGTQPSLWSNSHIRTRLLEKL